jgi:predicted metallo-beta-lactamase superfamily hydrolase
MKVNGQEYTVDFSRQLTPVSFFLKGKQVTVNRMATTCALVDQTGAVVDTATVRQFHRDKYSRKTANDSAFRKLADQQSNDSRVQMLQYFFDKPSK